MQSASGKGLHQYKDDSSFPYQKILSTTLASCLLPLASCLSLSDAARSWGGSAVLGVPPMSDCRGFPHERLHQDSDYVHL
ncbi:hypothetical protein BJP36_42205 [Moorena producens JHB]|uniref:Uncharacterized protein n=1 Tax=Moorena producens (strain JHB) TaxID=1454205 RepID=A0A9Q9UVM0_MOOP1|nr:hypothetical protein [Moorena producens]WAN68976.1 hypothetical protein BJP36_42205 [Moorena producens JHB]